jgi:hypothetical protein
VSLLGAAYYDPTTVASKSTASLLAMTALDTTNLRVTFTTPSSNGTHVLVRIRGGCMVGASTAPQILLGALDGSTIKGRMAPMVGRGGASTTSTYPFESVFLVTGLTNNTSYTWDAAYGVEFAVASTNIKYGGPDDTSTNSSFGGFGFEVWSAETLLAGTMYDPATVANASIASALAMTAFDTTNLRLTFTAPASGNVMVRIRSLVHGTTTTSGGAYFFGVLDGAAIRGRTRAMVQWADTGSTPLATDQLVSQARFVVTGLTPSSSYTWDAAYGVESAAVSGNISWGGPDNTSQDDAYGGFAYEVWDAGGAAASNTAFASGMIF